MAPKSSEQLKPAFGGRDLEAPDAFNNDQQGTSLSIPPTAKVEHLPLEQTTSSTAQSASSPQQAASTASPSLPSFSQPAPPEVHLSATLPGHLETAVTPSLWDRAYEALRIKDPQLVNKYEKLLSRELEHRTLDSDTMNGRPLDKTEQSLDETDNRIETNLQTRRAQLDGIIKRGLQRMEEKKIKYTIAGHEFVLQDQIAQNIGLVQGMKVFVGNAVAASPPASLAWAGVCVILPILTNPSAAEHANKDGFTYVTSRMRFYVALDRLVFPKNATIPKDAKDGFESDITVLYQYILEFQLKSILRFYRMWLAKLGGDAIRREDWEGMLSEIKKRKEALVDDYEKLNSTASRKELEYLNENANKSDKSMQQLLLVAKEQLQDNTSKLILVRGNSIQILRDIRGQDAIDLPMVEDALHDSAADQHIPLCETGTRVGILNRINAWVDAAESKTIFWISGPAGTGKSTISRSLARSLTDTGKLGASYFFRRGQEGRNGTKLIFPTIANQLINTIPKFRTCLKKSLERNPKVKNKALEEQFKKLILTPLSGLFPDKPDAMTRVIIIDALDECEQPGHISKILTLLSHLRGVNTIPFRVFVTSRSTDPFTCGGYSENLKDTAYSSVSLQEDFYEDTKDDISAFLKESFARIKTRGKITKDPWPEDNDLDRLITLATKPEPLFIYAATLCRFVDDGKGRKKPTKQLTLWLEQSDKNISQLNQIYMPILHQLLGEDEHRENLSVLDEDRVQIMRVLSSIILLATPLPARNLADLLVMNEDDVNFCLRNLHAVLNIPTDPNAPVRVLHKSFSDFLLGQESTGSVDFRVEPAKIHAMLASMCIQRMSNNMLRRDILRKDICGIRDPGKSIDDIDKAMVTRFITPDLEYACLYWAHHLQQSGHITDEDEVYKFLQSHFLHWLESLSLLRRLSDGILSIRELLKIVPLSPDTSNDLASFLRDAERFASSYTSIIEQNPLQTYSAALVFCPTNSKIKQKFWIEQRLPLIAKVGGIRNDWGSPLHVLEGHTEFIWAAALSPDGKTLASASNDETIRFWDAVTGAHKQTLEGRSRQDFSLAFSPDGMTLASASYTIVRLWNVATCTHKQTLKGHDDFVDAVTFSPGGTLASASRDGTIRLWDATGTHIQTLKGHSGRVSAVAFSPDGTILASASYDKTVRFWDAVTGKYKRTLEGHSEYVWAVAFSPDSKTLASASAGNTVWLWDTATGTHKQTLEGYNSDVSAVAFSPDGMTLALALHGMTVQLWDMATCTHRQTLKGHTGQVMAVAFLPNGTLASAADTTVRLWDATGANEQILKCHSSEVCAVTLSPDGETLASASSDKTVRFWGPY